MEIGPITGVRAVSPIKPSRAEDFVAPALAIDGSGRAGDDAYAASTETDERDHEEAAHKRGTDSDADSSDDTGEASAPVEADSGVDVFA